MVTAVRPGFTRLDEELCEHIARYSAAHDRRAEKLHFAEADIDDDRESTAEVLRLLEMARPELDGDEEAAILRLLGALGHIEGGDR